MDLSPLDLRTRFRATITPGFVLKANGPASIRPRMTRYYNMSTRPIVNVPGVVPTFAGPVKQGKRQSFAPLMLPPDRGAPNG